MYRLKQGRLHKVHIANLLLAANANGKKKKTTKKKQWDQTVQLCSINILAISC